MKHRAFSLFIIIALTGCQRSLESLDESTILKAKSAVVQLFNDPSSVQFFDVYTSESSSGVHVCGTANGRNAFGGYGKPIRFVVSGDSAEIESDPTGKSFDRLWISRCYFMSLADKRLLVGLIGKGDQAAVAILDQINLAEAKFYKNDKHPNYDEKVFMANQQVWKYDIMKQAIK